MSHSTGDEDEPDEGTGAAPVHSTGGEHGSGAPADDIVASDHPAATTSPDAPISWTTTTASYSQVPYDPTQPPVEPAPVEQPRFEQPQWEQPQYQEPQYGPAPGSYPEPVAPHAPPSHVQQPPPSQPGAPQYPVPPAAQSGPPVASGQFAPEQPFGGQQFAPTQPGFAPAGPPAPPAMPKPEDLLVPDQSPVTTEPASWGWRGRFNRGSGGLIKAKANAHEVAARQAIKGIQRSFSRPMTVVVVQPKGGAGKTPTTICLSAAFGAHRGGYVVGWDDNETRGTLAVRVSNPDSQRATVWDLLSDLAAFERYDARVGDLSHYVRSQPDAHFDALVSDDNPGNMAQIGEEEFQRLHRVLQRFYRMIVVDTGNNVRSPNWQAAVNAADLIVVVSTYQRDVAYSGSWVLDHLAQTGREDLARNAVTVLSAADPTTDKVVREQLVSHFVTRTRAVVEIPYDPQLAHGGPIRWSDLAPATRNAWVAAGATVVDALAEHDLRAMAARRA
jgi:MinD-like ATPase involved in chromosome partitioning or flagellar assembly